jgi:hypothetical protein
MRAKKCEKHPLRGKTTKSALFLRRGYFSENIPFDDFSRVFYPLRKNWGKSIDFGSRSWLPAVSPVTASFLGTDAQTTGNEGWTGRLFSHASGQDDHGLRRLRKHSKHSSR